MNTNNNEKLTGRRFNTDGLRSLLIAMVPLWLLLPFADDLSQQLPPLTIKVYRSADGLTYLHNFAEPPPLGQTGSQAGPLAGQLSFAEPPSDLADSQINTLTNQRRAYPGAPDVKAPESVASKDQLPLDRYKPWQALAESLWVPRKDRQISREQIMHDYAFSTQLPAAIAKAATARQSKTHWGVNFAEICARDSLEKLPIGKSSEAAGLVIKSNKVKKNTLGFLSKKTTQDTLPVVVLDPGHGGSDPGTIGPTGLYEKTVTLDIARRVQKMAREQGDIRVVLTRSSDQGLARARRLALVKRQDADLLLSLHFNALPQDELILVETFIATDEHIFQAGKRNSIGNHLKKTNYRQGGNSTSVRTRESDRIASLLQKHIFHTIKSKNPTAINAGVKNDRLFMLTGTDVPGALIEISCLSNAEEEKRLQTDAYRDEIAAAVLQSMLDFFNESDDLASA